MADNNIKPNPSEEGQLEKNAVKKPADMNAPFSLEEAKAIENAEEGQIEEAIEKQKTEKTEKEVELAPDLIELKKEQTEKKKEVKQKEKEVKAEVKVVEPSKFEGKSEEERQKIYLEMEKSFTQKSQKVAELEAKVSELSIVDQKIEDLKKESVVRQQKEVKVKLPEYPKDDLYYEDPVKYNRQVKDYNDAQLNARLAPLYGSNWTTQEDKVIKTLKDSTSKDLVPFEEVEKEVQSRARRNPAIVNQLGLGANQYFYTQVRNEMLPQKIEDIRANAKEEAKRELEEENKEISEGDIMSSDIVTQKRESQEVDFARELDSGTDPNKVIESIKKKHGITQDI